MEDDLQIKNHIAELIYREGIEDPDQLAKYLNSGFIESSN